jgi:hypothetical protein
MSCVSSPAAGGQHRSSRRCWARAPRLRGTRSQPARLPQLTTPTDSAWCGRGFPDPA